MREIFIDWLTASRYIKSLEAHLIEQRQDFTVRLAEKDELAKAYKSELVGTRLENDRMKQFLMSNPSGMLYAGKPQAPVTVPEWDGPLDWTGELQRMLKEEEHGISIPGRQEVHQPPTDDAA